MAKTKTAQYHEMNFNVVRNNFSSLFTPVNISLRDGAFPDKLKITPVTLVFKKSNTSKISKYRPIFVLSCVSQTPERNMCNSIFDCYIKNDFYTKKIWFLKRSFYKPCYSSAG